MRMRTPRTFIWLLLAAALATTTALAFKTDPKVGAQPNGSILVPNGQQLTPAGTHVEVNDRPLGMVLSPDRRSLAVVTGSNFNTRALHLIDTNTLTVRQTISISNSFVGVAFSPSGSQIYVGGGASNDVKLFRSSATSTFAADGTIP